VNLLKTFRWDIGITAFVAIAVGFIPGLGWVSVPAVLILAVLEWSLSFDNAIVNAKILNQMSEFWQKMFLTVGLLIAVGFMRLLFPILIVMFSAKLGFSETVSLALNNPVEYGHKLSEAHVVIAMFGGIYLLLIASGFLFDNEREDHWLKWLEAPLARCGKWDNLKYLVAFVFTLVAAQTFGEAHQISVLIAGLTSIALFCAVEAFSNLFESDEDDEEEAGGVKKAVRTGFGAFALFMYLEVQDSAFSFDGVTGAFAISSVVVVIAIGLGLGALYVRTMTVHLVKTGQLDTYRYLEHGAYWAITALATCLLLGVADIDVPSYVTGVLGIVFIGTALWQSIRLNKAEAAFAELEESEAVPA
jgi:hypothetical protein